MTTTKFCKTCGKIMWDAQPTKRYCDACIRKRNIKSAQASYQRRNAGRIQLQILSKLRRKDGERR